MYTKEQEAYALAEYERTGSVIETIRRLGYPSKATLYRWYERKRAGLENQHGRVRQYPIGAGHYSNTPEHPRNAPTKLKYEAIQRCFEQGEDVEYVSREIGYSRVSIYAWRRKYQKYGMIGLMAKKNSIPRQPLSQMDAPLQSDDLEALRTQIRELQLVVDVLKETIEVLKKTPAPIWRNSRTVKRQ